MAIYNAYLEGAEREAAILDMEINNQYEKLSMLYEMSLMELDQIKKDIELKVFKESGTYDDYEYLIAEAEAQASQDQKNLISQILDWFSNLIQKMVNGVKNFFNSSKAVPANTPVEAPEEFFNKDLDKKADGIMDILNGINEKSAPGFFTSTLGQILGVGVAAASIFVINRASKNKKSTAGEVTEEVKTAEGLQGKLNSAVVKIRNLLDKLSNAPFIGTFCAAAKDALDNIAKPVAQWLQDKINWGADILKSIPAVKAAADGINNAIDAAGNKINQLRGKKDETTTATPTQPTQSGPATINSATPNKGNSRIKVSYIDNSTGTPTQKTAYVNPSGKVMNNKSTDGTAIPAAIVNAIQTSQPVKDAMTAIANNISNNAMKNSPQAQLATGTQVNTANQNAAAQNAANQKAQKKAEQQKAKAEKKRAKIENNAMQNSPNAQLINNESVEAIREELGENYTVEIADDGVLEITINTILEMPEDYLSTTQSIFGMIAEEEANEDPELLELQKLFDEI